MKPKFFQLIIFSLTLLISGNTFAFGKEAVETPADHSKYEEKKFEDFKPPEEKGSSGGGAPNVGGSAAAQIGNEKIVLAERLAILNSADCESIKATASENALVMATTIANEMGAECEKLKAAVKSCDSIFTGTVGVSNLCHTEKNESIATSVAMIQGIMGAASGLVDACNDFGKAMNLAQKGMTAYTAACGAAQVACKTKCGGAKTAIMAFEKNAKVKLGELSKECAYQIPETAKTQIDLSKRMSTQCNAVTNAINKFVTMDIAQDTKAEFGVRAKAEICSVNVPAMLMSGLVSIGSFANAQAQSDQCKKDAEEKKKQEIAAQSCENPANKDRADCACNIETNKKLAHCAAEAAKYVDCGKSENADKPICICKANPRLAGCEGVSTALATNSSLGAGSSSNMGTGRGPSGTTNSGPTNAATATNLFPNETKGNGTDGAGLGGGGGGSSSAGLSGSGAGATDKADAAGDKAGSGLSANVLESGGAGGGGGFRGGFGGSYSSDYRNKLKAFANQNGIGAKLAGKNWTDQVTSPSGRTNFDKIKSRYQENKLTLIGGK